MKKIILISGKMRHGKDTSAIFLKEMLRSKKTLIIHFGDYLKFVLEEYHEWNGIKDEEGRALLQHFGTDYVREKDINFWTDTVIRYLKITEDLWDYVIIPDVRFSSEIERIKENFKNVVTLRVKRFNEDNSIFIPENATEESLNHISETDLDNYSFNYYLINNSTLGNLKESVNILGKIIKGD